VIGGFTDPQRSRLGLGALLVGYYDDDGRTLRFAGKVGTGFDRSSLLDLRERLDQVEQKACPFANSVDVPRGPGVHWVKPELVGEFGFAEWTQNGLLRQPRFEGLRMDKKPKQVRRERAKSSAATRARASKSSGSSRRTSSRGVAASAAMSPDASLKAYEEKRDFSKTPEPRPKLGKRNNPNPIFVVQEHHATRLHYDLRLEVDGVLKSWAVTKQPSADPSVKRLAVQTEDHPIGYAEFEGDIPAGEYGAGHMTIWDRGTYANLNPSRPMSDSVASGKIEVELRGKKLKGAYALVRMAGRGRGENWLLIKKKDRHARAGDAGDGATSVGATPASPSPRRRTTRGDAGVAPTKRPSAPRAVSFTNVDKVFFPAAGYTKGDVLGFYEAVAPKLIPHLRDRPITIQRFPDGVRDGAPSFWQKNTPDYYPDWIPRVEIPNEQGKRVQYALVNDEPTLLYLVNQGALTFHPFLSRVSNLDRPDYVLFDLDPGDATFADAVKIAKRLRTILEADDADPLAKTSGKSGLHVLVPWTGKGGYDAARAWAMERALRVEREMPEIATAERSKAGRRGRVYVDVIQNAEGHHAVPPYVVRATSGATVSTPLEWKELTPGLSPTKFDIKTAVARFRNQRKDPMAALTGS
jgi:bifunctional non-homologous end joining protein LigD